ncbi:MAG: hypothetical protein ACPGQL_06690 [Thermoplasmatota archaeon]
MTMLMAFALTLAATVPGAVAQTPLGDPANCDASNDTGIGGVVGNGVALAANGYNSVCGALPVDDLVDFALETAGVVIVFVGTHGGEAVALGMQVVGDASAEAFEAAGRIASDVNAAIGTAVTAVVAVYNTAVATAESVQAQAVALVAFAEGAANDAAELAEDAANDAAVIAGDAAAGACALLLGQSFCDSLNNPPMLTVSAINLPDEQVESVNIAVLYLGL